MYGAVGGGGLARVANGTCGGTGGKGGDAEDKCFCSTYVSIPPPPVSQLGHGASSWATAPDDDKAIALGRLLAQRLAFQQRRGADDRSVRVDVLCAVARPAIVALVCCPCH
eukprot:7382055-Prymnesium_polylepis.1